MISQITDILSNGEIARQELEFRVNFGRLSQGTFKVPWLSQGFCPKNLNSCFSFTNSKMEVIIIFRMAIFWFSVASVVKKIQY